MSTSAYKRGYEAARLELARELQKHNSQLAARLADVGKAGGLVDAFGMELGPRKLDDYERGVLNGAITANRTLLMFLGTLEGEGTGKELGIQPGD